MLIFVSVEVSNSHQIDAMSLMRYDNNWNLCASYHAIIDGSKRTGGCMTVTDAFVPLTKIIHKRDVIIFLSQQEKEMFCCLAKRHLDSSISKRTYILPPMSGSDWPIHLSSLASMISNVYPCVSDLMQEVVRHRSDSK